MITDREMFCTFVGVITTHQNIPRGMKKALLISSAKEFGISQDHVEEILKDLEKTLEFVCTKVLKKLTDKDNMFKQ